MQKISRLLDFLITRVVAASILLILVIICTQVFFRFALNNALPWPEEASRFLMIWALFLGGAYAFYEREHASVTYFSERLSGWARRVNDVVINLLIILFLGALIYGGWQEMSMLKGMSTGSLRISRAIPYAAIPTSAIVYIAVATKIILGNFSRRPI
ncbi:MAG: hypothetical protein DSY83_02265 [Flavobacteriia bacterium]|nr:MAG: hypothetical protein DSY83_02265 [Flavobacteriia bacterium]